jgi:hypothetical protein
MASVNDDKSGGNVDNDGPMCSKLCPERDVASRFVSSDDRLVDWTLSELNRCCNWCVVVVAVVMAEEDEEVPATAVVMLPREVVVVVS